MSSASYLLTKALETFEAQTGYRPDAEGFYTLPLEDEHALHQFLWLALAQAEPLAALGDESERDYFNDVVRVRFKTHPR